MEICEETIKVNQKYNEIKNEENMESNDIQTLNLKNRVGM